MERNFTNENFERFLRQNAEGLRMHPSDNVWKNISGRLNKKRRRFGWFLGLSLLVTSGLGYFFTTQLNTQVASGKQQKKNAGDLAEAKNQPLHSVENNLSVIRGAGSGALVDINRVALLPEHEVVRNLNNLSLVKKSGNTEGNKEQAVVNNNPEIENSFKPGVVDSYTEGLPVQHTKAAGLIHHEAAVDPLTIESVLNSFKQKKSKLGLEFYFTPTISYRKLSENKSYLNATAAGNLNFDPYGDDVNNAVTHKPNFGLEIGLTGKYPISKNVKVRAGIQFNVNRYEIKTYNTSTELATIRLRNGIDSLNAVTNYNNFSGYKSNWLQNFYLQVSAPVGLEVKLMGDEKMQFGIATTIQPTYVLGDRVYLISTDYKNYAEVPRLIRRWNINTSLETFVSYSTGHLNWQVGPQVRYQLLSSFVKKYPVKENLFDFGLKVGISLNKQ